MKFFLFCVVSVHVDLCAEVQQRLQQFSREVLDLLKNQGFHCRLPVSKFVSAYHQYYSRQCRVADYGFSKIIDLLSAIPKSIQVLKRNLLNIVIFIFDLLIDTWRWK